MKKPASKDLSSAFALVGMNWSPDRWQQVDEAFGATRSKEILAHFQAMERAFWSIKPRHNTGSSVMHDAKTVRKDFLAAFPEAPEGMVRQLENEYLYRNR